MEFEIAFNSLDNEWWFDLGISIQKTNFHHKYNYVCTISLGFISLYFRFIKKI